MVWGETTDFWFTPNSLGQLIVGSRQLAVGSPIVRRSAFLVLCSNKEPGTKNRTDFQLLTANCRLITAREIVLTAGWFPLFGSCHLSLL